MDRDNDEDIGDCANYYGGYGWWYKRCFHTVLTRAKYNRTYRRYIPAPRWYHLYDDHVDLKNATMMFREKM